VPLEPPDDQHKTERKVEPQPESGVAKP